MVTHTFATPNYILFLHQKGIVCVIENQRTVTELFCCCLFFDKYCGLRNRKGRGAMPTSTPYRYLFTFALGHPPYKLQKTVPLGTVFLCFQLKPLLFFLFKFLLRYNAVVKQ